MPDSNDPLRTTDYKPDVAPPASDVTRDYASASPSTASDRLDPGTKSMDAEPILGSVPGYEIESVLGRGGMGVVYRARHISLKRTVALKMVLAGAHAGPRERARFRIEAEAVARLQH